jgi:hypothetical protein
MMARVALSARPAPPLLFTCIEELVLYVRQQRPTWDMNSVEVAYGSRLRKEEFRVELSKKGSGKMALTLRFRVIVR